MTVALAKWTIADYHRMIVAGILDDRRVELLKGEIVEMMPEGEPHAYFSSEAGEYLARSLSDRAMIHASKPITLPNNSEPEPDLAIVHRLGREYLSHHPYPENILWLIEYSESSLANPLPDQERHLRGSEYSRVLGCQPQDPTVDCLSRSSSGGIRDRIYPDRWNHCSSGVPRFGGICCGDR